VKREINIGKGKLQQNSECVNGSFVEFDGEEFYKISHVDKMQPFFISIVSDSDHWMYISSNGSLTAGRSHPENVFFPYYSDDKIHDYKEVTGSKSIFQITIDEICYLWEPFSERLQGVYKTEQNLFKNTTGNRIIFEEINHDLKIIFRYSWMNSERFGWVRKSTLVNIGEKAVNIGFIDGIQNIMPFGVQRTMQGMLSTLLDAYKKCELTDNSTLALFRMSSIPVDRAEPSEALKATTVWCTGIDNPKILLSNRQLNMFRQGGELVNETDSRGIKGAYFLNAEIDLQPNYSTDWYIVAEVAQDASQIVALMNYLKSGQLIIDDIRTDVARGNEMLLSLVAGADGVQVTNDKLNTQRHFANTMFNIMRGGIPSMNYTVVTSDFVKHIAHFNRPLFDECKEWISSLPETIEYDELISLAQKQWNPHLIRLTFEYLPLMFSRRHGDPSRPWNLFNIKLKNDDGSPSLYYQGNWRDIFQNWEALANSYPAFLPGMIFKFLNATTIDGYNPYKVTRDGFDWELMDPSDPWSNIGYWGDHQIIYLEKLIELSEKYFPGNLGTWMEQPIFAFANVPYQHKPYEELLKTPQDTILFDSEKSNLIAERVKAIGEDGKLLCADNKILTANFAAKVLAPLLSKLSNFIPGAGIWMNTQRPEWNDANNALVGNGASMVTVYYLRRYVNFISNIFKNSSTESWPVPAELFSFFSDITGVFLKYGNLLKSSLSDTDRKLLTDELGQAGSRFRKSVYSSLSGEEKQIYRNELIDSLDTIRKFIDQSIQENRRTDGLFHAYNLIIFSDNSIRVRHLYEMLEGQVALLSSGYLSASEAADLLDSLRLSQLYRNDQLSYTLYPDRQLPKFLEKNNISAGQVSQSKLLTSLIEKGNTDIILNDENGNYHFNGSLNNGNALKNALAKHSQSADFDFDDDEVADVLGLYEQLFDHQSFTGRSGTFFKYEGLGCIYWHMVSKLLLAVGENIVWARSNSGENSVLERLIYHYWLIREGIGSHKQPNEYGAFPTDPYSHTPAMAGVQQPGMTGQVKEDLLSRMIELGIEIRNGEICFSPTMLNRSEFIDASNLPLRKKVESKCGIYLSENSPFLAFSFCGVPVLYCLSDDAQTEVQLCDGSKRVSGNLTIDRELSRSIFLRDREIKSIRVSFSEQSIHCFKPDLSIKQ